MTPRTEYAPPDSAYEPWVRPDPEFPGTFHASCDPCAWDSPSSSDESLVREWSDLHKSQHPTPEELHRRRRPNCWRFNPIIDDDVPYCDTCTADLPPEEVAGG